MLFTTIQADSFRNDPTANWQAYPLYNDAGDGYGYENGEYTAVKITYSDRTGEISEELSGTDTYRRNVNYRIVR